MILHAHPYAGKYPMLPDDEHAELVESIAANGLRNPTALADEATDWDETRTFADWAKDYPMEES